MGELSLPFSAAFQEKYDIIECVGRGAFGAVFRARHLALQREVAIKHLAPKHIPDESMLKRFLREAKVLSSLSHPNIVAIYDYGVDGQLPYLVQELLSGRPLDEYMMEEAPVSVEKALSLSEQIAQALQCAHSGGVVHRDLKPANIFVSEDGIVKVLDFGLALTSPELDDRITKTGLVIGTPGYMAPELFYGKRANPRSDLYALGLILFELLTDHRPGADENGKVKAQIRLSESAPLLTAVIETPLPNGLEAFVDALLRIEPEDRPASAEEVLLEIRKLKSSDITLSSATGLNAPLSIGQKEKKRTSSLTTTLAFVLPLLIVVILGLFLTSFTQKKPMKVSDFLAEVNLESATLKWISLDKVPTIVEYGKTTNVLVKVADNQEKVQKHSIRLSGLTPNTRYVFRPVAEGYLPAQLQEFRTKSPLSVSQFRAVKVGATEVEFLIKASESGKATVQLIVEKNTKANRQVELTGTGPQWRSVLKGLLANSKYKATVTINSKFQEKSRSTSFVTPLVRPFLALAELRPDKKGSSSPIISPLMMEDVSVHGAQQLYGSKVLMAIDNYGLHCYDLANSQTLWHQREDSKIRQIRLLGNKFISIGSDQQLRCYECDTGRAFWKTMGIAWQDDTPIFFTKEGIFLWREGRGPAKYSALNGTLSWQLQDKKLTTNWYVSKSGLIWIVGKNNHLFVYDCNSGQRRVELERDFDGTAASSLSAVEGNLLLGLAGPLTMVLKPGGYPRYLRSPQGRNVYLTGEAPGKVISILATPPTMTAFALETGKVSWTTSLVSKARLPLVRRGFNIYLGDERDYLVAINCQSGLPLWERYGNIMSRFRLHATKRGVLYCGSSMALMEVIDGLGQ